MKHRVQGDWWEGNVSADAIKGIAKPRVVDVYEWDNGEMQNGAKHKETLFILTSFREDRDRAHKGVENVGKYKVGEETTRKVIESAAYLFATKGYNQTSIDEVMKNIGLTKGTFYNHFKSKKDLFMEVIRYRHNVFQPKIKDHLQKIIDDGTFDFIEWLHWSMNHEFQLENIEMWSLLYLEIRAQMRQDEEIRSLVEHIYNVWKEIVVYALDEGKRKGQIRTDVDSLHLADVILAIYDGFYLQHHLHARVKYEDQFALHQRILAPIEHITK